MSVNAFDLLVVTRHLNFTKLECIEASGNDLYLGSDESTIVHLAVEERTDSSTENVVYSSTFICQRNIGTKKPISSLKSASVLQRLLVLSDLNLYLLDGDVLSFVGSGPKIRNVLTLCINENPNSVDPFTLQFCVGKRKCLQICTLQDDRISLLKEISTQDPPMNLAMDGKYVCVAGVTQYCVFNVDTGVSQDLFPCDPSIPSSLIKRISKEEFLVMGPGNLGMFVTAAGTSERPPIHWSEGVIAFSYYHPYIITLASNFIRIYSLIDQQHKQTLPFNGGVLLGNFDGQVYVATHSSIFCLMPQPWTSQVMALLENECIQEAIELTEHSGGAGLSGEKYLAFSQKVFQTAGFIRFSHGTFDEAREYFLRGRVDVREILSLFPGLLPSNLPFVRAHPPLHSLADINQAFQGEKIKIEQATDFLLSYLLHLRSSEEPVLHRLEVDTALIALYSERNSDSLGLFLDSGDIVCALDDCVPALRSRHRHAALAKLYRNCGDTDKCLEVLTKLIRGELKDPSFQGISQLVEVILDSGDEDLVWRYADFLLDADESEGLRMFCEFKSYLDPNRVVLKCLAGFPKARISYLHHLINFKNNTDEKYHTELVLYHIDEAAEVTQSGADASEERVKLQTLLNTSTEYNPKTVLAKLKDTNLIFETAMVYGRMKEHEKALTLLVHRLRDFSAAEKYCVQYAQNLLEENKSFIYATLLKIYLRPPPGGDSDAIELAPALDLLATHSSDLNLEEVLAILPSEWSVSITHHYLKGALRSSLHKSRVKKIEQNLIKCENLKQKFIYSNLCKAMGPIHLNASSICSICGKGFICCDFSLFPNGVLTHRECVRNKAICPLTGTMFKALKQSS